VILLEKKIKNLKTLLLSRTNTEKMDNMELVDILSEILYPEIVNNNNVSNVRYFKQRMKNEPVSEELMNEAIGILEELLNSGGLEYQINNERPENRQNRKKNMNKLISICEKLAGVSKHLHPSFSPMQSFY
jgi:hypothetical protein